MTLDVVTGAFSYTGRHIAEALFARGRTVRTLTRQPHPSHPLADRVETAPLGALGRTYTSELARNIRDR